MFYKILLVLILCIIRSSYPTDLTCKGGIVCTIISENVKCGIPPNTTNYFKNLQECLSLRITTIQFFTINKELPGDITLAINGVVNATVYTFENSAPNGYFILRATEYNLAVKSIIFSKNSFFLNQSENFFHFFPKIEYIRTNSSYLRFGFQPAFSILQSLLVLSISVLDPNGDYGLFTVGMVQNLALEELRWNGNLHEIEPGSFNGLSNLTHLDLSGNLLTTLPEGIFIQASNIKMLNLDRNMLNSPNKIIFAGVNNIETISIDNNPGFPVQSLKNLRSLRSISLKYNSYTTLDHYTFQQLPYLTEISLEGNPFYCDCNLRWASLISSYGINIESGTCFAPLIVYDIPISNGMAYFNCPQSDNFPCFNKSIDCGSINDDFFCHNKNDGRTLCTCDIGFSFLHSEECIDQNECNSNRSDCESICVNTLGSYECECLSGYRLNSDGVSCGDLNECLKFNGGCMGGCRNTVGAYECFCEKGYKVVNGTECVEELVELPYIIWGGVTSVLLIASLIFLFILILICIYVCCKNRDKSSNQHKQLPQQLSTPSSYTRMESAKPPIPPNRPSLPAPRGSERDMVIRSQQSFHNEELTYEAFDIDN